MENYFAHVVIIGGGASGLVCGIACAGKDSKRKIMILEKE